MSDKEVKGLVRDNERIYGRRKTPFNQPSATLVY